MAKIPDSTKVVDGQLMTFMNYLCTLGKSDFIYKINVDIINIRKDLGCYIML